MLVRRHSPSADSEDNEFALTKSLCFSDQAFGEILHSAGQGAFFRRWDNLLQVVDETLRLSFTVTLPDNVLVRDTIRWFVEQPNSSRNFVSRGKSALVFHAIQHLIPKRHGRSDDLSIAE